MGKLRLAEAQGPAQSHRANQCWGWDFNLPVLRFLLISTLTQFYRYLALREKRPQKICSVGIGWLQWARQALPPDVSTWAVKWGGGSASGSLPALWAS